MDFNSYLTKAKYQAVKNSISVTTADAKHGCVCEKRPECLKKKKKGKLNMKTLMLRQSGTEMSKEYKVLEIMVAMAIV